MKRFLKLVIPAFLGVLLIQSSFAQKNDKYLPIVAYWTVGDSFPYQVTKVKKTWKDNLLMKVDSSSYFFVFQVVDSTADSYQILWKFNKPLIDPTFLPENIKKDLDSMRVPMIIYSATENGAFVGIDNWPEIFAAIKKYSSLLLENKLYSQDSLTNQEIKQKVKQAMKQYNSKEVYEQVTFKELSYFHYPFGLEFDTKNKIKFEELIVNPFTKTPIRLKSTLKFDYVDKINQKCKFTVESYTDKKDAKKSIDAFIEKMQLGDSKNAEILRKMKVNSRNIYEMEYNYFPGFPINITVKIISETFVDKQKIKQVEVIKIKLML